MIQKLNGPHGSTAVAPYRQQAAPSADPDSLPSWGSWLDGKFYRLDVVQQPIRARMCGFGDKDRRPLAPATVAKLIIHDENENYLTDTDIDGSFFVVTADLWSADGKAERNLVLHPTSSDRHATATAPKKRRTTHSNATPATSQHQSDSPDNPTKPTSTSRHVAQSSGFVPLSIPALPNLPSLSLTSPYDQSNYPTDVHVPSTIADPLSATSPVLDTLTSSHTWSSYDMPPPPPPSATQNPFTPSLALRHHSVTTQSSTHQDTWTPTDDAETGPYRTWSADPAYGPLAPLTPAPAVPQRVSSPPFSPQHAVVPVPQLRSIELREAPPDAWPPTTLASSPPPASAAPAEPPAAGPHNPPYDQSMYAPASFAQGYPPGAKRPLPGHTYTRTLVGPLAANACRLLDEHRKPGIFFLFQDLSVRTEGSFRLRLRLMNIGALPAPEPGATSIHTGQSPILAEIFTDAFDVYSAKRFPGVPDTTALSIAFGNQGQKLPLRNRHGSRKDGRRRRRDNSDTDSDSDGP